MEDDATVRFDLLVLAHKKLPGNVLNFAHVTLSNSINVKEAISNNSKQASAKELRRKQVTEDDLVCL